MINNSIMKLRVNQINIDQRIKYIESQIIQKQIIYVIKTQNRQIDKLYNKDIEQIDR